MNENRWSFSGSVPENYDRYLVPVFFAPYAEEVASRIRDATHGPVLETACGTGAGTRALRHHLPLEREIVATDFSAAMLAFAESSIANAAGVSWQLADASNLTFPDGAFGAVVCQFGLMFVPDRPRAVREARRVLAPGGRFVTSVWASRDTNRHVRIYDEIFGRHGAGKIDETEFARPYSMGDHESLAALFCANGFSEVTIEDVYRETASPSARDWARGAVSGTPRGQQFRDLGCDMDALETDIADALAAYGGVAPCKTTLHAVIVTALA